MSITVVVDTGLTANVVANFTVSSSIPDPSTENNTAAVTSHIAAAAPAPTPAGGPPYRRFVPQVAFD